MGFFSDLWISFKKIFNGTIQVVKNVASWIKEKLIQYFTAAQNFLKEAFLKIKDKVIGLLYGAGHAIRKLGNYFQEVSKNFVIDKERGKWKVTVVTKPIAFEDIPEEVRKELMDTDEYNDTKELDNALAYA